jgi:uncharacterized membrane protein
MSPSSVALRDGRPAQADPPSGRAAWPVPLGLLGLSALPVAAGVLRLLQLGGGPAVVPADDRFSGVPVALLVHIAGAAVYALAGALQFLPRFRTRHPGWHRRAGRVLAVAGLAVAVSALWLTLGYPPKPGTGTVLLVLRLTFASAMVASLVLGVGAARRHDVAAHRAWMIRAYAIGVAAGTQAFTGGVGEAVFGTGVLTSDLATSAGWVINLAVAEYAIRRPSRRRPPLPSLRRAT